MSVPELRVVDTPIYDDMIIEHMEDHVDDVPMCDLGDFPASDTVTCLRCRTMRAGCPKHVSFVLALIRRNAEVECAACHVAGPARDLIRVVPL